jgi:hypothetical protein
VAGLLLTASEVLAKKWLRIKRALISVAWDDSLATPIIA